MYELAGSTLSPMILVALTVRREFDARLVLRALVYVSLVSVAVGVLGLLGVFTYHPAGYGSIQRVGVSIQRSRLVGFHGNPNLFAGELLVPFFFLTGQLLAGRKRQRRAIWALMQLSILLIGIALSFSRGVWVGLLAGVMVFTVMARGRKLRRKFYVALAALVLAVVGLIATQPAFTEVYAENTSRMNLKSSRLDLWREWVGFGKRHPVVGFSPGTVAYLRTHGMLGRGDVPPLNTHNFLVTTFVDMGLAGVALMVILLVSALKLARGDTRPHVGQRAGWMGPFLQAAIASSVVASLFSSDMALGAWVAVGIAMSGYLSTKGPRLHPPLNATWPAGVHRGSFR